MNLHRLIVLTGAVTFAAFAISAYAQNDTTVTSPDGTIQLGISVNGGQLKYEVAYRGKAVIEPSELGMDLQDQPSLGGSMRVLSARADRIDETYTVPAGKANPIHNVCNTLSVSLQETGSPHRKLTIEARAYDDGVAFRYLIPTYGRETEVRIVNEKTQFHLSKDATTYPLILRNYQTSWEDNYRTVTVEGIHPESLVALPLLADVPGVAWIAITEADIDNYAGMYLTHPEPNATTLAARLSPRVDVPGVSVITQTPMQSPWRVIMIGAEPGRLIESNIVTDLNPPSAIADTSWIKPGKSAWNWWSGNYDENVNFKPGMNTATMEHYIDFASKNGVAYMLIDAGWAARGAGPNSSEADITETQPNINMSEIVQFAKARGVKIWLWSHWTDISRQMDDAFPLFAKWGISGVKIDFMNRDDQWMVDFYRRVVKKAAENHLMIDFHGAFKPDGLRRTYPNLLTREGVMGLEYNKWSARITPDHNVMLAFTRMLAGPMDFTPGGFRNVTQAEFVPRNVAPEVMGTRAHQTALFVVFESPLEMMADDPEAYEGTKELPFLRAVPTSWDQTRVINARVGDYITIARRHGKDWYVGSITGWHANTLDIPLSFLGPGKYTADIYSDASDSAEKPADSTVEHRTVDSSTHLKAVLVSGGGQAIRIHQQS
ncbi:MAG TPA: glycoside hydrolase family 97 protein [Bryobacteraceae bacterium]|jgi:alpha-glucosidase|nr:glycoside hydrolase family 97 protein [Bryobacteraceae bacterium]